MCYVGFRRKRANVGRAGGGSTELRLHGRRVCDVRCTFVARLIDVAR